MREVPAMWNTEKDTAKTLAISPLNQSFKGSNTEPNCLINSSVEPEPGELMLKRTPDVTGDVSRLEITSPNAGSNPALTIPIYERVAE